ncbi:MAG: anti-sigma factor family protein [Ktedonobacteraceae bacterium]
MSISCQECEELSGAFVLDAVTPEEHQAIEEHIATCVKCFQKIKELQETVAMLSLVVPQIQPSPGLLKRILAALRRITRKRRG